MPTERSQLCVLRLVYPPISNQEAEWLRDDIEVRPILAESNFYVIGRRAEAILSPISIDQDSKTISLSVEVGTNLRDEVTIHLNDFPSVVDGCTGVDIDIGPKIIRVWALDETGKRTDQLLYWAGTEKLFFDFWRRLRGITGLARIRDLTTYELLYAGISKKDNAFERLLNKPHDKRLRILANEQQITAGARVTDETYLFFFKTDVLRIHTYDHETNILEEDRNPDLEDPRIVADAEKAFVSLIQSRYNAIQYKKYPQGRDGLFNTGLARYCYVIGEDLTFCGPGATIVGAFEPDLPASNDADAIFIEGDVSRLIKSKE